MGKPFTSAYVNYKKATFGELNQLSYKSNEDLFTIIFHETYFWLKF